MRYALFFLLVISTLITQAQSDSSAKICHQLHQISKLLNTPGDWLTSVKGDSINFEYIVAEAYNSKIVFENASSNALIRSFYQQKDSSKGSYYFAAVFGRSKNFKSLDKVYEQLKQLIKACMGAQPSMDIRNRFDEGDGYFKMKANNVEFELNLYENSFVGNDKIILLTMKSTF